METKTNNKNKNFELHKKEVCKLAKSVNFYGKSYYAIGLSYWGSISEPGDDPEDAIIYGESIEELAKDTFEYEPDRNESHYPGAPYGSIFDY